MFHLFQPPGAYLDEVLCAALYVFPTAIGMPSQRLHGSIRHGELRDMALYLSLVRSLDIVPCGISRDTKDLMRRLGMGRSHRR